jgi:hypothetical protein
MEAAIGAGSDSDEDFQAQLMEIPSNSSPPLWQVDGVSKSFGRSLRGYRPTVRERRTMWRLVASLKLQLPPELQG